jgi:predicted transposase/invertase (TIGR01784 family)
MNSAKSYGYRQGVEDGIKENKKEIAKKMLEKNKPIDEIIEFTGLSKEEIEQL